MTAADIADEIQPPKKRARERIKAQIDKTPWWAKAGAATAFGTVLGFYAEVGLASVHEYLNPDPYKEQATTVRKEISDKATAIHEQVGQLSKDLVAIRDGGSEREMKAFIEQATALVASLDDIAPTMQVATTLAADLDRANFDSKAASIENVGFSLAPDFVLRMDEGVTLCGGRATFGVYSFTGSPHVALSAPGPNGESKTTVMAAGERLSVRKGSEVVTVMGGGWSSVNDQRLYAFNFSCETDPASSDT